MIARACAFLLLSAAAAAVPAAPGADALSQKQSFVQRLVEDSPVARRIRSGDNAEARALLETAADQYRQALAARAAGDLAGADKLLNDAIWSVGRARQLSPDRADELIHRRAEYSRLSGGLDALRASYLRHLQRLTAKVGSDPALLRVDEQLDRARALAAAESFAPAVRLLQEAERDLVAGMTRLLGSTTLLYLKQFDTPQEEFAFELDRNRSYEDLVPLAVRERRPTAETVARIDHLRDVNRALVDHAQRHAGAGEWTEALAALRRGTEELQKALALAGVVVPAEASAGGSAQ